MQYEKLLFGLDPQADGSIGPKKPLSHTGYGGQIYRVTPAEIRRLLEEQEYRCALTGQELTPEVASLDHIVPLGASGDHSIDNLQILHQEVNRAKGTMTQDAFVQMCRAVAIHASKWRDLMNEQQLTRERGGEETREPAACSGSANSPLCQPAATEAIRKR